MKKLLVPVFFLGAACAAQAQEQQINSIPAIHNIALDFSHTSAANAFSASAENGMPSIPAATASNFTASPSWSASPALAPPASPAPAASSTADPAPAPEPKFIYGGRDDYRWQVGLGLALVRFRSSVYYATAIGVNSSVAYYTNEWFAVEGSFTGAFAPSLSKCGCDNVRFVAYGVGPRISWRKPHWEPWLHGIVGGAHVVPQTALGGKNAFEVQAGGGADYRLNPRLSARLEVDWIRTSFFGQTQNNAQGVAALVLHF